MICVTMSKEKISSVEKIGNGTIKSNYRKLGISSPTTVVGTAESDY